MIHNNSIFKKLYMDHAEDAILRGINTGSTLKKMPLPPLMKKDINYAIERIFNPPEKDSFEEGLERVVLGREGNTRDIQSVLNFFYEAIDSIVLLECD